MLKVCGKTLLLVTFAIHPTQFCVNYYPLQLKNKGPSSIRVPGTTFEIWCLGEKKYMPTSMVIFMTRRRFSQECDFGDPATVEK